MGALTAASDTHAWTPPANGTARAVRRRWRTQALTEADEQFVHANPATPGQQLHQLAFCLVGSFCIDETQAVRYTMDVCVDADRGLTISERHDQRRGLTPNPVEGQEFVDRRRYIAGVFTHDPVGYRPERFCLGLVETNRVDRAFHCAQRQFAQRVSVRRKREKPAR